MNRIKAAVETINSSSLPLSENDKEEGGTTSSTTSSNNSNIKAMFDSYHDRMMMTLSSRVNLTWWDEQVSWIHDEIIVGMVYHRWEQIIEPYLPEMYHVRDVVLQPMLTNLQHRVDNMVIQYYHPYFSHYYNSYIPDEAANRELLSIAFLSMILSLWTAIWFRNPRFVRRHQRRLWKLQQQQKQQQRNKPSQQQHHKHMTSNSNHSYNNIHYTRPHIRRGTEDSQRSSKDGGSLRSRLTSFDLSFRRRPRLSSLDPYWGEDHALFVEHDEPMSSNTTFDLGSSHSQQRAGGSNGAGSIRRRQQQRQDDRLEASLYDDEFDLTSITYYGPLQSKLRYSAWTPPPTWAEASRRVIPQDASRFNLQRQLILDIGKAASLKVVEGMNATVTSTAMCLPISEWSVHIRPPIEGGVMELYIKNTPKEDWLELTFTSAHACAQFQLDVLAYQVFGNTLSSLYQALEIVHQGSAAHPGKEFVLHDMEHGEEPVTTTAGGVAWDDAMRALNSLPIIRLSLERLLVVQRQAALGRSRINSDAAVSVPPTPKVAEVGANASAGAAATPAVTTSSSNKASLLSLTEEYLDKRLLLGPVDFFRLFVPPLPQWALPQSTNTEMRVTHLLRWRKRVGRAATLVQAYVRARTLVNQGWNLNKALPDPYLVRRLAYDDDEENQQHDLVTKNEYYEAIVSRDVRCGVRTMDKSKTTAKGEQLQHQYHDHRPTTTPSAACTIATTTTVQRHVLYQAYTLVGCHVFRLPKPDKWRKHSLRPNRDPVEALSSLRALISSHPEEDFMVNTFFCEGIRIALVQVYVRSLPTGIDPKFDAMMKKYKAGSKAIRDKMLQALVYLGQNTSQSFSSWIALRVLFYLLSWTRRCRLQALPRPTMSSDYFLSLPSVTVCNFSETFHYGGGAVNDTTDGNLPSNYVAMSAHIDSRHMPNALARLLHGHIERGVLADCTVDFTLILEGQAMDELPERALSTVRMVHFSPTQVALPVSYSSYNNDVALRGEPEPQAEIEQQTWIPNPLVLWSLAKIFLLDPLTELVSAIVPQSGKKADSSTNTHLFSPASQGRSVYLSPDESDLMGDGSNEREALDVVEAAVTTIVDILAELRVPVRKTGLTAEELARSEPIPKSFEWSQLPPGVQHEDFTSVDVLYRSTRSDVKRFLLASDGDIPTAALRLAESVTWRSFTFPIEVRSCRIELQSGQFFQQGKDRDGNPVFYFRNMCLGPWRKDEDAAISAVLHRLETSLQGFYPSVKCTIIILMRRPFSDKMAKSEGGGDSSVTTAGDRVVDGGEAGTTESAERESQDEDNDDDQDDIVTETDNQMNLKDEERRLRANPRLPEDERYYLHTSASMIRKLIDILLRHYPERLSRALVVPSVGNVAYFRTVVGGRLALSSVVGSNRTRNKVKFLKHFSDLRVYVKQDELVSIVGGTAVLAPNVFEAR